MSHKITEDQFELLARLTGVRQGTKEAARRVLIGGESSADVARAIGLSRQSVSNTLARYRKADSEIRKVYKVEEKT